MGKSASNEHPGNTTEPVPANEHPGNTTEPVPANEFYAEYHGHKIEHLERVHAILRPQNSRIAFLAGDSSLDNKHWLYDNGDKINSSLPDGLAAQAIGAYQQALVPPRMVRDVAYWVNHALAERSHGAACINASIEESTIADRFNGLREQDCFIRDHMGPEDVLIVSVGGNDVALKPAPATQQHLAQLMMSDPSQLATHPSLAYIKQLFGDRVQAYIEEMCSKCKPRVVVVCLVYFPCEVAGGSWADGTLEQLGYNAMPGRLQALMEVVFATATRSVQVEGTKVVPLPLHNVLDSKDPADYKQRVEPSIEGGRKMGEAFVQAFLNACS